MKNQSDFFQDLWRQNQGRLDTTKVRAYDPEAVFISLIARVENTLAKRIYSQTHKKIYEKFPSAYIYSPAQYHITVVGFPSLSELTNSRVDIQSLNKLIDEVVDGIPTMDLELKNLNILPGTIIVEAYDLSEQLHSIASKISNNFLRLEKGLGPNKGLQRERWWVTLARLEANMKDLVSIVKIYRSKSFGNFRISFLDLVSTDKTFTLTRTRTIASYKLQND